MKEKKAIIRPLFIHIVDQITDIGVIIQFFQIWQYGINCSDSSINSFYIFIASSSSFILYRIISCILMFLRSKSKIKSIYQLFDLLIFYGLKMNYKYERSNLSKPQIWLHFLESLFNSFPQSLIQLYFIVQTGFTLNNILIIISVIFSILSLTSSMMMQDNKEFDSNIFDPKLGSVFRFYDIFYRLSVLSLIWIILGDLTLFIVLFGEFVVLATFSCKFSQLSYKQQTTNNKQTTPCVHFYPCTT